MKKLLTTLLLACCLLSVKAQYVTIPGPAFVNYLQQKYPGCMNGNQLDTTCAAILAETSIDVYARNLQDLTGIRYFKNLKTLLCVANQLNALPILPPDLEELNFFNNNISSVNPWPPKLTLLSISQNPLSYVPPLPVQLKWLAAHNCNFDTLPPLPPTLISLIVDMTTMSKLPALPEGLLELTANNCGLNSLPALPSTLQRLECFGNHLTQMPVLPSGITSLVVGENYITKIDSLPANLERLDCSFLLSLSSLPPLPSTLRYLYVGYNVSLTCLPTLPATLQEFSFGQSGLTCLPNYPVITGFSSPALSSLPLCSNCSAPVFTFGKITSSTATILWNKINCITNFRLAYRVKGTSTWTALVSGPGAKSRILSGLTPGTQYEIRMRTGCTSSTLSAWSAIQTFKTDVVCVAPSSITVTNIKKDRVTLNWTAIAGVYSYKIRYRVQGTSVWANQTAIAPVVHKTITGLAANTTYEYQMLTVCDTTGAQASGWTGTATFKTTLRMEDGNEVATFTIYPNPVTTQCTVRGALSAGDELVVTDILGRELITERITQSADRTTINVSGLSRGVYFVMLRSAEGSVTRKFVKE